ncbi:MAG TPA: hypothetical protein VKY85_01305 [Candidatus Angelobacter sp.]|nr:hypothetical protein [Candidatus Angelobacter sp.]
MFAFALAMIATSANAGTVTGQIQTPALGGLPNATITFALTQAATVSGVALVAPNEVQCYTDGPPSANSGFVVGQPNPALAPALSTNTASGTLPSATYFTKLTIKDASGRTLASPESTVLLTATGTVNVAAPILQPPTATGYEVWMSTTSGSETLQGSVTGTPGSWGNYSQSAALVAGASLPTSNSTVCTLRFNDELQPSFTCYVTSISNQAHRAVPGYPQYWYLSGGSGGTVNLGNGLPAATVCQGGGMFFPIPLFSQPAGNAMQSLNGPLNMNGFPLIGATLSWIRDCTADGVVAGTNSDNGPAISLCLTNAFNLGQGAIQLPPGVILVSTSVNDTNKPALNIYGVGSQRCRFAGSCGANYALLPNTTVLKCNTGSTPCWDATGSGSQMFRNLTFDTFFSAPSSPSTVAIMFGRDNAGGSNPNQFSFSQWDLLENVQIQLGHSATANSNFGNIGIYNTAAEQFTLLNSSIFADTGLFLSGSDNLGLASPYQTLIGGSMSDISLISTSIWFTSSTGAGIVAADGVNGLYVDAGSNIHSKLDGTVTGPSILATGNNTDAYWKIFGTHEDLSSTGTNGAFINMAHSIDRLDVDVMMNDIRGSGSPAGYIQWGGQTGLTLSNSRIRIKLNTGSGSVYPLIQNTANTITHSTLDLAGTLNPASLRALTLTDVDIFASGFTDANITLPAGTTGTLRDNTGISVRGAALTVPSSGNNTTLLNIQQNNGVGAITGNAADQNLCSGYTIKGNTIGPGKGLIFTVYSSHSAGAAAVSYKVKFGGTTFDTGSDASAGVQRRYFEIWNNPGVQNAQTYGRFSLFQPGSSPTVNQATGTIDFTQDQTFAFTFNVANTDTVTPGPCKLELVQ